MYTSVFCLQSGAIMAVIGIVCSQNPDARLAIAFIGDIIPHSFSADSVSKPICILANMSTNTNLERLLITIFIFHLNLV